MRSPRTLRALFQTVATMTLACGGTTFGNSDGGGGGDGGSIDSGVDRTGFDLDVCEGTTYHPVTGLSEQVPVDYVELRSEQQQWTDAMPPMVNVTDKEGTVCAKAMDLPACSSKLANLRTQAGWMIDGYGGGPAQVIQYEYVAYTRADEVNAVTTVPALTTFLMPIDTVKDAALIAHSSGHRIVCDGRKNGRKTASGWELITQTGHTCGPNTGIDEHIVSVSTGGTLIVVSSVRIRNGDMNCAIGRRPEGLIHVPTTGDGVGAFFAAAAHLEAASVVAFERLAEELHVHGAPSELIRDALRAAKDEVRHARATRNVAERYGAQCSPACVDERPIRDLLTIATENAVEGCVRETFGALVATYQSLRAEDPMIARLMKRIAVDETRHASLAWRIAAWADAQLSDEERARVREARRTAAERLRIDLASEHDREVQSRAGMPTGFEAQKLFDGVARDLWAA